MEKLWQKLGMPEPNSEASAGELSFKENEIYSGIEIPEMPFFVRLDGWGFHGLAEQLKIKKPFDKQFIELMTKTAEAFFMPFNPCFAYLFSDEISILFMKATSFRRVEKIDSVFAGMASSILTNLIREKYKKALNVIFDCRCIPLSKEEIIKYLIWRQAECFRNCNNAYAQHLMIEKERLNARAAAKKLKGMKTKELLEFVKKYISTDKIPKWHSRGVALYKEAYQKKGFNPITKKTVVVQRMKAITDYELPVFASKEGKDFAEKIIGK